MASEQEFSEKFRAYLTDMFGAGQGQAREQTQQQVINIAPAPAQKPLEEEQTRQRSVVL